MRPGATFGPEWLAARLRGILPGYPDVRLCVAYSGGLDSTALLAALAARRPKQTQLRAVHVNHGLHPRAAQWASHCRTTARQLDVPLQVLSATVAKGPGVSLEAAARDARYGLLAENIASGETVVTAHHEDDQLETVLLQLFRGAGLAGLSAMPELAPFACGWLARPLLSRTREELESWVRAHDLTWVEDETNADERLDRNYLRRSVVPLIRARWKGVGAAVARSARHAQEARHLLDALALGDIERAAVGMALSVKTLRALPAARRRNALRAWIGRAGIQVPDTRRLDELAGPVIDARHDANPLVKWANVTVQRHADLLSIRRSAGKRTAAGERTTTGERIASGEAGDSHVSREVSSALSWSWRVSPSLELPAGQGSLELRRDVRGPVDLDTLPDTLTIRWRSGGERLRPRRGGPRRALKSLLQEAHLPIAERARLPLAFSGASLVAVADMWLDESVQAGPKAIHRGRLHWIR